jgi:uncharacterized protein (TIGR00266 family)
MKSHEIEYRIVGESIQIVEIILDSQETVIAEAGAMLYMEEDIAFQTKMGDGSSPDNNVLGKLLSAGTRLITGESLFLTHFTNRGSGQARLGFSAPYPGTVIPINLTTCPNNEVLVQRNGFLCAALGTKISIALNKKIGSSFFGGEGFILQRLQGDGFSFVHAGGTVIEKQLDNEELRVDTSCIVAFESTINYDIQRAGGLKSMVFGGEGIFLATLTGRGKVWLQSMPIRKLIRAISPSGVNRKKREGHC